MCPFIINKPELCEAALSSLMIDDKHCSSAAYKKCPLFLINKSRQDNGLNEYEFTRSIII